MPDPTLTPRELDVLDALLAYLHTWHMPPTRRELGAMLTISRPTVEIHLQRMARKGVLRLEKRWRGISIRG